MTEQFGWWQGAVMYQIYPRSFMDANGDGIGDLAGIADRLEYVAALGVDGIWLSPFFTSPMKDFGYDIADYQGVDPMFGDLADFDHLVEKAHSLGLKVIIDQVYSHTSDLHPWFQESHKDRVNPKTDWYVWADPSPDGTPPNNWLSAFGGSAWQWDQHRRQYYLHNFVSSQPDLNFHNREVQDAILEVADFWMQRGVDGFRLDVANYFTHDAQLRNNPPSGATNPILAFEMQRHVYERSRPENLAFVARLRATLDRYPDSMMVAELFTDNPMQRMVEYTNGPDRFHTAYSFVFLGPQYGANFIRDTVHTMITSAATAWPSWSFSNHDRARVMTRWWPEDQSPPKARALLALLASLRGTAFIYQGEELGLPEADVPYERIQDPAGLAFWPEWKGRDGCRTPMPWSGHEEQVGFSTIEPWLPVDPRHRPLAVDAQDGDPASTLTFSRRLLAWRKRHPALITGNLHFLEIDEPLLAFVREGSGERLLCVFNLSPEPIRADLSVEGRLEPVSEIGLPETLQDHSVALPGWGVVYAMVV